MDVFISFKKHNIDLRINLVTKELESGIPNQEVMRYLKGILTNKERFISRFSEPIKNIMVEYMDMPDTTFMSELEDMYDDVVPYTYNEAFAIENDSYKAKVFGSINITDMITSLGHKRIATEGKQVKHKKFDKDGTFLGTEEYDVIYEVHEVNGEKLGLTENVFAIRCWCTTTDKEHWLWIEEEYKNSPLEAVASTFRIHENLISNIKEIKRQGDVLLVEMNDENIKPEGNIVPLNATQYFSLLTAQS
jgi:hypothetical protein